MEISKVQAIISILLVAAFIIVTSVIALIPVIAELPPKLYTEHLKTFASIYTGILGIIVGFYFGRSKNKK